MQNVHVSSLCGFDSQISLSKRNCSFSLLIFELLDCSDIETYFAWTLLRMRRGLMYGTSSVDIGSKERLTNCGHIATPILNTERFGKFFRNWFQKLNLT